MNLTRDDIQLLVREPSAAQRSRIAEKICAGYNSGQFTETEARLASEIFRLLLKDTEMRVRRVLADQLKDNPSVPHDIIWSLAHDKTDVAVPVLQYSPVLSEEDLVAIVRATRDLVRLKAVASRASVSRPLGKALLEKKEAEPARALIANPGAYLGEEEADDILRLFAGDPAILQELVYRGGLPHAVAEKLFYKVSGELQRQLTRKYRLKKSITAEAVENARETATLEFLAPWMSQQDIAALVAEMDRSKRLTDSVILRSLCIGDLRFFEAAIARRVGVSISNAKILVADPGPLGFKALYANARLPEAYYECVRILLRIAQEETLYGMIQTADYCNRMIGRIVAGGYDKTVENMDTLLIMLKAGMRDDRVLH